MATLVLRTVGQMIGGPIGSAVGAFVGSQIDAELFKGPAHEGPRLKELAVTSSSYGRALPRIYGRMRMPGTLIWSTDLVEQRETSGGKGKPKTVQYSYSLSFAVALSSRPIDSVGRIWADGNLLRGAAGDLKTGGTLRVWTGVADQDPDPLLAAELGDRCPAHRDLAYCVFEELDLTDFGNRVPALSFEVFAGDGAAVLVDLLGEHAEIADDTRIAGLAGFAHEGGTLADVASGFDIIAPLVAREGEARTAIALRASGAPVLLPPPASWSEEDFEHAARRETHRATSGEGRTSLRYYDVDRDYQPGLQEAGSHAEGRIARRIEFPAAMNAAAARGFAAIAHLRSGQESESATYLIAQCDADLGPGDCVALPDRAGVWRIEAWELREAGVELHLLRERGGQPAATAHADPGSVWSGRDRIPRPTDLRVFELPWDGNGAPGDRQVFAAVGAESGRWDGAALFAQQQGALQPLAAVAKDRAVTGVLEEPLGGSSALRFEPRAMLTLIADRPDAGFAEATLVALSHGANRLLVGSEIVQFAQARPLDESRWQLTGLLRGRGATEAAALAGHAAGTQMVLLDDRLVPLPPGDLALVGGGHVAAIGAGDAEAATARIEQEGRSRQPPVPVHPRHGDTSDGLELGWTRRARGGWTWLEEVEQPLVEQVESYEVGLGPVAAPLRLWRTAAPQLVIAAAEREALAAAYPGAVFWVRQAGSYARSDPLSLDCSP